MPTESERPFLESVELGPWAPLAFHRVFVTRIPSQEVEDSLRRTSLRLASESLFQIRVGKPISKVLPSPGSGPQKQDQNRQLADKSVHLPSCVHLNADCVPVRGMVRAAIYDLTRREIHLIPAVYLDLLDLLSSQPLESVLEHASAEQAREISSFVGYLVEHELVGLDERSSRFPSLQLEFVTPGVVDNAIVDIDCVRHDFASILTQLDELGCRHLEVRRYSGLMSVQDFDRLLHQAAALSFETVELILPFDNALAERGYEHLMFRHPIVASLTVHSSPTDREAHIVYGGDNLTHPLERTVRFSTARLESERDCGIILPSLLNAPTVRTFAEATRHNGCLNKKVSIDRLGMIRNCPSMPDAFGSISDTRLCDIVNRPDFQRLWSVSKDLVDVCKRCEFRFACSDCRAHAHRSGSEYGKPLKCGYDPETGRWDTAVLPSR